MAIYICYNIVPSSLTLDFRVDINYKTSVTLSVVTLKIIVIQIHKKKIFINNVKLNQVE